MKRSSIFALTVVLLISVGQTVQAAARSWEIDKVHTNFYFQINHIYAKVNGRFSDFSGEVKFDPKNLAESRFFFEIRPDSISTEIAKRDKHLQSADFFDSEKYPLMTFESVKITDMGNSLYNVLGKFTVKGQTYDLTLPLTFEGIKNHPALNDKEVIGFNGDVTIDRLAYKIGTGKFYEMGLVGKDVHILVTLEALSDR